MRQNPCQRATEQLVATAEFTAFHGRLRRHADAVAEHLAEREHLAIAGVGERHWPALVQKHRRRLDAAIPAELHEHKVMDLSSLGEFRQVFPFHAD